MVANETRSDLAESPADLPAQQAADGERQEQYGGGTDQPGAAVQQPFCDGVAPSQAAGQRSSVSEAAHQEKHRNHHEDPGERTGPCHVGQRREAGEMAGTVVDHDGDRPVTHYHQADCQRPEEIDVPLPPGRRPFGELSHVAHVVRLFQHRPHGLTAGESAQSPHDPGTTMFTVVVWLTGMTRGPTPSRRMSVGARVAGPATGLVSRSHRSRPLDASRRTWRWRAPCRAVRTGPAENRSRAAAEDVVPARGAGSRRPPPGGPYHLEPFTQLSEPIRVSWAQPYRLFVGQEVVLLVAGWALVPANGSRTPSTSSRRRQHQDLRDTPPSVGGDERRAANHSARHSKGGVPL